MAGSLTLDAIARSVAVRVGLQESDEGVLQVLRVIASLQPVSTRTTSRHTGIPVPIVTAVCNELRTYGVLEDARPARLSAFGRQLMEAGPELACPHCRGHEVAIPPALRHIVDELERAEASAPPVDVTLDQSHCTAETKVRRALYLLGTIVRGPVLFIGDDDLTSLALVRVARSVGLERLAEGMAVVDVDERVLGYLEPSGAALVHHDLREPLPSELNGRFVAVVTDPPYTLAGAELFVSRAVSALQPGPGRTILLCFGPKGPEDASAVQASLVGMRLSIAALVRNFNEYIGSGVLGGVGHLYHLLTSSSSAPSIPGSYEGPLYTADVRATRRRG